MRWLKRPHDYLFIGMLAVCSVVVYMAGAQTGLLSGDPTELTYGLKTFQPIHAPGYPLYLLIGTYLLDGLDVTAVHGAHLISGLYTSLGLMFLYSFLRSRYISIPSALAVTIMTACSSIIWLISTQAEVYSLLMLMFSGSLFIWSRAVSDQQWTVLLWFWTGLSLCHHPVSMFQIPLLVHAEYRSRTSTFPVKLSCFILPGLMYFTLLLPGSGFPFQWPLIGDVGDLFNKMMGGGFRRFLFGYGAWTPLKQSGLILKYHVLFMPYFGVVCYVAGLFQTRGYDRVLLATQLGFVLFISVYAVPDLEYFLIPSYLLAVIFIGRGLDAISFSYLKCLLILGVVVSPFLVSYQGLGPTVFSSTSQTEFGPWVKQVDRRVDRGVILSDWRHFTPLRYHQLVRGRFNNVDLISIPYNRDWSHMIKHYDQNDRAVYTTINSFSDWEQVEHHMTKRFKGLHEFDP